MSNTRKLIVVDVEATCYYGPPPVGYQEIIWIGAVRVASGKIERSFSGIVRPERSQVSEFCTRLTGLTAQDVRQGKKLYKVLKSMESDLQTRRYPWASWGDWDRKIIQAETARKKTEYPFSETHFNLKSVHASLFGLAEGKGLQNAAESLGIKNTGRHHSAIDDATLAAKIFIAMQARFRSNTW